jgi:Leucine-rich repeat (LRR) protein
MRTFNYTYSSIILTIFGFSTCSTSEQTKVAMRLTSRDSVYITSTQELQSNKIPDSVFQMKMLKTLMVFGSDCDYGGPHDDNKPHDGIKCWMINEIPLKIANLVLLDTLRLTLGAFGKFPYEVANLKNLRFLDLTDTFMSDINNLMTLKNLNQLWLYGCGLSKLPDNIGNLSNLKFIGLVGNNLDISEVNRIRKALPNCKVYYH